MKRNPGQASRHEPGFHFAQSGLLPRPGDQLISLDPELRAAPLIPAHGGIQTGSPRSRGRAEIYRLLWNSDAAAQPRKDSHSIESLD